MTGDLRRVLTIEYDSGQSITARFCPRCYRWASTTLRNALFPSDELEADEAARERVS